MTSLFRSSVLAAGLVVLAGVTNASAQIEGEIEFTTSFAFTVGNTTVPAGSYTINRVDEDPQVLELRGGRASVLFRTESVQPKQLPAKDEVVFSKYGNGYVLKNVFAAGSEIGYAAENALGGRRIAKGGGTPTEARVDARKTALGAK
jgi:hypothetical protein